MNNIICPISTEKVSKNIVRLTGFLVAISVLVYATTLQPIIIAVLLIDFTIRAFSIFKFSPLSYIACGIATLFKMKPNLIDKAPKLFAARVGIVFTVTAFVLYFISVPASVIVMLVLMSFASLESIFDFCVGCVVYTYLVLPIHNRNINKILNK